MSDLSMIRPTVPEDTAHLVKLAEGTGVFKPMEIDALRDCLVDYNQTLHKLGHHAISHEVDGRLLGFAYYAPAQITERTWYLYWIAVTKDRQAHGIGSELLAQVERNVRALNGRLLFIETSSTGHYELTRRFYRKQGYEETAVMRDYYADDDHMVVFRKRL
jgi:GNAT superfamily N-acetyltransferase